VRGMRLEHSGHASCLAAPSVASSSRLEDRA
jgi:hypothetical protein